MKKYWHINVIHSLDSDESVTLPGDTPIEDVKRLLQWIMAKQLTPTELRECIWLRNGGRSDRLDIQGGDTDMHGTLDTPGVYARLVDLPDETH